MSESNPLNEQTFMLVGRIASKKNSRQIARSGGKTFVRASDAWLRCEREMLRQLSEQFTVQLERPYHTDVTFFMKSPTAQDVCNGLLGIHDLLADAGIIDDDKNILSTTARKVGGCKDYLTTVRITSLAEPNLLTSTELEKK